LNGPLEDYKEFIPDSIFDVFDIKGVAKQNMDNSPDLFNFLLHISKKEINES
jgi:hypothetical protein